MIKQADTLLAAKALKELFGANAYKLELIGHSGNSVYSFFVNEEKYILRLTDRTFRSFKQNEGEIDYINHLSKNGLSVASPIKNINGDYLEELNGFIISSFLFAPGSLVLKDSPLWSKNFFELWGSSLAKIHNASESFDTKINKRWSWSEELLIKNAKVLIPRDEKKCIEELTEVVNFLSKQPKLECNFGMTHADYAPQNFNYDEEKGLTAFDFGNCCYHWYLSDLAISLSTIRRVSNREELKKWLVDGYSSIRPVNEKDLTLVDWLIRLRVIYVYLSRLHMFGSSPNKSEAMTLVSLREKVEEKRGWG